MTVSVETARRALFWCALVLPAAPVGAAFFAQGWPAQRFLVFYVAPLFLAAPLWVRVRLRESTPQLSLHTIVDATVFMLSFARFVLAPVLPFSGHMMFLTYSGLTTRTAGYRLLALLLLAETTWFKLWLWRDSATWSVGLILGIVAAGITLLANRQRAQNKDQLAGKPS
ncbi:MAG: hypothetical protein ACREMA_08720 [Longimicrobiales bacterium]